jgi:hypothetical protein
MKPMEALLWMKKNMIPYFPLGVIKDKYNNSNNLDSK